MQTSDDPYPRMYAAAVVDAIDGLRLPRYGLGNYLEPRPALRPTPAEADTIKNLGRAGSRLIGFSRTNLFKRLESGGPAFLQSVERHVLRNFVFLHALEQGLAVPIGEQDVKDFDTQFADADELDEEIEAVGVRSEADYQRIAAELYGRFASDWRSRFDWLRADLFRAELARDLLHDAQALIAVLERSGRWDPARDRKLLASGAADAGRASHTTSCWCSPSTRIRPNIWRTNCNASVSPGSKGSRPRRQIRRARRGGSAPGRTGRRRSRRGRGSCGCWWRRTC